MSLRTTGLVGIILCAVLIIVGLTIMAQSGRSQSTNQDSTTNNAVQLVVQGRQIFRFGTFGDQAYWGDTLKLHRAIEGSGLGGVGPGASPKTAVTVGLKVDASKSVAEQNMHHHPASPDQILAAGRQLYIERTPVPSGERI